MHIKWFYGTCISSTPVTNPVLPRVILLGLIRLRSLLTTSWIVQRWGVCWILHTLIRIANGPCTGSLARILKHLFAVICGDCLSALVKKESSLWCIRLWINESHLFEPDFIFFTFWWSRWSHLRTPWCNPLLPFIHVLLTYIEKIESTTLGKWQEFLFLSILML